MPSVRVRRSLHVRGRESRRSQRGFALCHSATEATDGFVSSHDGRSVPVDPSRGHPSGRGAHPPRPQSRPGRGVGLATLSRHPEGRDSLPYVHVESVSPRVPTVASFFSLPSLQQGNFNSSIGSDGYMLSSLTCGMAPVTSITEGLQQVSCA